MGIRTDFAMAFGVGFAFWWVFSAVILLLRRCDVEANAEVRCDMPHLGPGPLSGRLPDFIRSVPGILRWRTWSSSPSMSARLNFSTKISTDRVKYEFGVPGGCCTRSTVQAPIFPPQTQSWMLLRFRPSTVGIRYLDISPATVAGAEVCMDKEQL